MNAFGRILLLVVGLLAGPLAHALSLGGLTGNGAVGERLDAYVPLYGAPGETRAITTVEILPDMFSQRVASDPALDDMRASVEHSANGSSVHIVSTRPVAIERLQFRLRVATPDRAVVGRYAVRLLRQPVASSSSARIVSRPNATRAATPTVAPVRGDQVYGPVRNGESLWTIARQLANGGSVQQMMKDLHALNPSAFVNGDMNRLRVGVTLSTPTGAATNTPTAAKTPDATPATALPTTSASATPATDARADAMRDLDRLLDDSTGRVDAVANATAVKTTATASGIVDDALTAKLAALDAKFAAIRAKYDAGAQATSAIGSTSAVRQAAAEVAPPVTAPVAMSAVKTVKPQVAPAPFVSVPVESSFASPDRLLTWAAYALGALVGVVGLGWALRRLGGFSVARSVRASTETGRAADAGRKADVARKAENRVRMESEIKGLLDRKGKALAPGEAAPRVDLADTADRLPVSAFEQTMDLLPGAVTDMLEQDREVAIDASIAHGRYAEAEALLREVCKSHPRNVQAKLRLAEVYYITEQIEGFGEVATDIKDHHRPELTDDEWQRVVRMGKIIAPDLVLFSGPKAVGRRA